MTWSVTSSGPAPVDTGRLVVYLHGNRDDKGIWAPLWTELPQQSKVAFDLPGHGGTPLPASTDMEDHVDDLVEAISALGATRVTVVGHSLGGQLALAVAARRPPWLDSLVVIASALTHVQHFKQNGATTNAAMARAVDSYFFPERGRIPEGRAAVRSRVHQAWAAIPWDQHARLNQLRRVDGPAAASQVAVPALLVFGWYDRVCPWRPYGRQLHDALPGSQVLLVRDAAHFCHLERPDVVAGAIERFCATASPLQAA